MLGVTFPTPLYPQYQQRFGLSTLLITVTYAAYAVGVIVPLVVSRSVVTTRLPVGPSGTDNRSPWTR